VKYVAAIGGNELETGVVNIKNMMDGTVSAVNFDNIYLYLKKEL